MVLGRCRHVPGCGVSGWLAWMRKSTLSGNPAVSVKARCGAAQWHTVHETRCCGRLGDLTRWTNAGIRSDEGEGRIAASCAPDGIAGGTSAARNRRRRKTILVAGQQVAGICRTGKLKRLDMAVAHPRSCVSARPRGGRGVKMVSSCLLMLSRGFNEFPRRVEHPPRDATEQGGRRDPSLFPAISAWRQAIPLPNSPHGSGEDGHSHRVA